MAAATRHIPPRFSPAPKNTNDALARSLSFPVPLCETSSWYKGAAPVAIGKYVKFSLARDKAKLVGRELKVAKICWVTDP